MSTFLSPARYNQAELEGLEPLCCRAIECFRPTLFAALGFPFAINSMSELWRYTEAMHEGIGLPQPMEEYLMATLLNGGITEQELGEAMRIKQALDDLAKTIGRPIEYPVYSMLLAFGQARHIASVAAPGSTVVELGGGAGYLGALLVLRGYRYIGTDVAQALYILQSNLLARLSAGGVIDLVDRERGADDLSNVKPGQAALVPWWRWVQRSTLAGLSIDVATSNHNFLEMHPRSRGYHLAAVAEHLSPQGIGFVFEGWGDPTKYPQWTAVKDFADHGFEMAHNDIRIASFVPRGRYREGTVLRYPLPLEHHIPVGGPSPTTGPSGEPLGAARSFWERAQRKLFNVPSDAAIEARLSATSRPLLARLAEVSGRLTRLEQPVADPQARQYTAPNFANDGNPISRAITSMRAAEKSNARLTLQDYKNRFGLDQIWTEDDKFLAYVYRSAPLGRPWITALPK